MTLFNYERKYSLTIGGEELYIEPQEVFSSSPLEEGNTSLKTGSVNFRSLKSGNAVEITDLQMQANISGTNKSAGTDLVSATIKVYNLSEDTRSFVSKVNSNVILKAGYASDPELPIIFSGQIIDVDTKRRGSDQITTINCKDGYVPRNTIRVSKSYESTSYETIFKDLASIWSENGIKSSKVTINADQTPLILPYPPSFLLTDWSYEGYLTQAMDDICKEFDYEWFIVNSTLYVQPRRYRDLISVVNLSLNQIKSLKDQQTNFRSQSTDAEKKGILVKTFLDGRMDQSKRLVISEGDSSGSYKIVSVSHTLDYRGNAWDTELTCEGIT